MEQYLAQTEHLTILTDPSPTFKERLAASELQRGLYQLGCRLPARIGETLGPSFDDHELRFILKAGPGDTETYEISAYSEGSVTAVIIRGASEQALLYGVFDFLERQGAFFGMDGDSYPLDPPVALLLPDDNWPWSGRPRLAVRGLLPWPDFLNCITVFNREDLRAYFEAMLRMRFNTFGVHVYGQKEKWAESFLSFEYGGVGHAAFTDTTATDRWGCLPQRTSRYGLGAAQYFDDEVFGTDATRQARSPWEAAELAQNLWRDAFAYAEQLGIRTGIGFEPYQLPDEILRACPPEVRLKMTYDFHGRSHEFTHVDPESRAARDILEARLGQLLETYPSVSYIYLWEDEFMNWASRETGVPLSVTPFKQAHDFLRRHAPNKRLVLAGWGGVARHFDYFHQALPEDIIFTCLSDSLGWDPIHEVFGKLEGRERWPIPWLEDDPGMWLPQLHVHRFARDIKLAEDYGCQGMLGIHWRHRIVDINATFMARRFWNGGLEPQRYYHRYARVQAAGERVEALANLLDAADAEHKLLSTWNGSYDEHGHAGIVAYAGDYSEAFAVETGAEVKEEVLLSQAQVIAELAELLAQAATPREQERLSYLWGQIRFLDPFARAWQAGVKLHHMLTEQRQRAAPGEREAAITFLRDQGLPVWLELLQHVRQAVLAFQRAVATRNDLGMLASIHNKLVRIATFRLRASLLEFLDELPPEVEAARLAALGPDRDLEGTVFVPTRPTRLDGGEMVKITAIAPGIRQLTGVTFSWQPLGTTNWQRRPMVNAGRRTYIFDFTMPPEARWGIEYRIKATFAGTPEPLQVEAPASGPGYLITR